MTTKKITLSITPEGLSLEDGHNNENFSPFIIHCEVTPPKVVATEALAQQALTIAETSLQEYLANAMATPLKTAVLKGALEQANEKVVHFLDGEEVSFGISALIIAIEGVENNKDLLIAGVGCCNVYTLSKGESKLIFFDPHNDNFLGTAEQLQLHCCRTSLVDKSKVIISPSVTPTAAGQIKHPLPPVTPSLPHAKKPLYSPEIARSRRRKRRLFALSTTLLICVGSVWAMGSMLHAPKSHPLLDDATRSVRAIFATDKQPATRVARSLLISDNSDDNEVRSIDAILEENQKNGQRIDELKEQLNRKEFYLKKMRHEMIAQEEALHVLEERVATQDPQDQSDEAPISLIKELEANRALLEDELSSTKEQLSIAEREWQHLLEKREDELEELEEKLLTSQKILEEQNQDLSLVDKTSLTQEKELHKLITIIDSLKKEIQQREELAKIASKEFEAFRTSAEEERQQLLAQQKEITDAAAQRLENFRATVDEERQQLLSQQEEIANAASQRLEAFRATVEEERQQLLSQQGEIADAASQKLEAFRTTAEEERQQLISQHKEELSIIPAMEKKHIALQHELQDAVAINLEKEEEIAILNKLLEEKRERAVKAEESLTSLREEFDTFIVKSEVENPLIKEVENRDALITELITKQEEAHAAAELSKNEIFQLKERIEEVTQHIETASDSNSQLAQQQEKLTEEKAILVKALEEVEAAEKVSRQELEVAKVELEKLKIAVASSGDEQNKLAKLHTEVEEERNQLAAALNESETAYAASQQEIALLELQLQEAKEQFAATTNSNAELTEVQISLAEEKNNLSTALEESQAAHEVTKGLFEGVQQQLQTIKEQLAAASSENLQLLELQEALKSDLSKVEAEGIELTNDNRSLQDSLSQVTEMLNQNKIAQEGLVEDSHQLKELLKEEEGKTISLTNQLEQQKGLLDELQESLQNMTTTLEKQVSEKVAVEEDISSLKALLIEKEQALNAANSRVQQNIMEKERFAVRSNSLEQIIGEHVRDITDQKEKIANLTASANRLQEEKNNLLREKKLFTEKNNLLERQKGSYTAENLTLNKTLGGMVASLKEVKATKDSLAEELTKVSETLKEKERNLKASEERGLELSRNLERIIVEQRNFIKEKAALEKDLEAMALLKKELHKEKAIRTVQEKRFKEFAETIATQKNMLKAIQESRNSLAQELETIRQQYRELLGEVAPKTATTGDKKISALTSPEEQIANVMHSRFHIVEKGETLSQISVRYYGTANRWQEIYKANVDKIPNQNAIKPGTKITIP